MVRIGQTTAYQLFCEGWKRSSKGNLYKRLMDGDTVTIFPKYDGCGLLLGYAWCRYTDDDGPTFSRKVFEGEKIAMHDVFTFLRGVEEIK